MAGAKKSNPHLWETVKDEFMESGKGGERYLPRSVRMVLTEDEYRRSTAKKNRTATTGMSSFPTSRTTFAIVSSGTM